MLPVKYFLDHIPRSKLPKVYADNIRRSTNFLLIRIFIVTYNLIYNNASTICWPKYKHFFLSARKILMIEKEV